MGMGSNTTSHLAGALPKPVVERLAASGSVLYRRPAVKKESLSQAGSNTNRNTLLPQAARQ